MKELPLGMGEATALLGPQVCVQRDGDSQEGVLAEDVRVVARGRVVVQEGDPAAMPRDGGSEVLQQDVRIHCDIADHEEDHLQDLESSPAAHLIQEILKRHWG